MARCTTLKEYEFLYIGDIRLSIAKYKGRKLRVWVDSPEHLKIESETQRNKSLEAKDV